MYLSTHQAADYLVSRPDWNGQVMLVTGGSQDGQQSIVADALHPAITHVIVNVPAGADSRGRKFGRMVGFPHYFPNPGDGNYLQLATTSAYFDIINFAPKVRVPALVGLGLIDTTCPGPGTLTMLNQLAGLKESVIMPAADHGGDHSAFYQRAGAWNKLIRAGQNVPPH